MKRYLQYFLLLCFLLIGNTAKSQILISLLFGDALNTPKIEFGLIGGWNRSQILTIQDSKALNNLNLGFYFHINIKNNSFISTGVLVKSSVGAKGMPVYSLGNNAFDSLYSGGELIKKIHYFYVPIQYHYRLKNRWYFEGGIQLGVRNKGEDIFEVSKLDGDLKYTTDVRDTYKRLDAGLIGGIGYKFSTERKSMSVGVNYYYGLVDVSDVESLEVMNSMFNVFLKIPIGANKKDEK